MDLTLTYMAGSYLRSLGQLTCVGIGFLVRRWAYHLDAVHCRLSASCA